MPWVFTKQSVDYKREQQKWKTFWQFLKKLNLEATWPSNSTLNFFSKKEWKQVLKYFCTNVHSNIIHNSQKMKRPLIFLNGWKARQTGTHTQTHTWTSFSHKQEWRSDICYDVHESQKHPAKWEKSDSEGHILYKTTYMKFLQ